MQAQPCTVQQFDPDSTLIRRGVDAETYSDMAAFFRSVQTRPLDKLLADLPGLAELSETKFSLAREAFRRRVRELDRPDYEQLRVMAFELADETGAEIGDRIRSLFSFA